MAFNEYFVSAVASANDLNIADNTSNSFMICEDCTLVSVLVNHQTQLQSSGNLLEINKNAVADVGDAGEMAVGVDSQDMPLVSPVHFAAGDTAAFHTTGNEGAARLATYIMIFRRGTG